MAVRSKCPICRQDTDPLNAQFPFCSERCRTQDLANWSTEKYVVSSPLRPEEIHLTQPEEDFRLLEQREDRDA
jgi:uncharacterized protein